MIFDMKIQNYNFVLFLKIVKIDVLDTMCLSVTLVAFQLFLMIDVSLCLLNKEM